IAVAWRCRTMRPANARLAAIRMPRSTRKKFMEHLPRSTGAQCRRRVVPPQRPVEVAAGRIRRGAGYLFRGRARGGPGREVSSLGGAAAGPDHGGEAALDILIHRGPTAYADAHGRVPLPHRRSTPAGAILLQRRDHPAGALGIAER